MNPSLEAFVNNLCPIDRVDQYRRVFKLVQDYEIEQFEPELTDLAMSAEMYEPDDIADLFHTKIFNYLKTIIGMHDIQINENSPLGDLIVIAESIQALQQWDDHDAIVRITEVNNEPEEKFAELIHMVSHVSETAVFTMVDYISPAFIKKLQEIHVRSMKSDKETNTENEALLNQLKIVNVFVKGQALGLSLLKRGVPIGVQIMFYIELLKAQFETMQDEALAKELFVLLHMSEDTYNNTVEGFSKISDILFDDLNKITKIKTLVTRHIQEFDKFKLSYTSPAI